MTSQDRAIAEIKGFLREHFPQVAASVQPISDETPPPMGAESALLSPNAVSKRKREFAAGRFAAHSALAQLGHPLAAIGRGTHGQPIWPKGILGSITHHDNIAVAIATPDSSARGIGIDLDLINRFHPDLADAVLTADEKGFATTAATLGASFSAKEATYKAIHPTLGKVIGFQDVTLEFSADMQTFSARPTTDFSPAFPVGKIFLSGRVFVTNTMILSLAEFG